MIKSPLVGIMLVELHIPQAHSLKERRQVVNQIKDRLRAHFNISVTEFNNTDKWQQAFIGLASISSDRKYLERQMQLVFAQIEKNSNAEIINHSLEYL